MWWLHMRVTWACTCVVHWYPSLAMGSSPPTAPTPNSCSESRRPEFTFHFLSRFQSVHQDTYFCEGCVLARWVMQCYNTMGNMYCASVRFLVIRANMCTRRSYACTSGESTRKWVLTPLLGQHVLVTEQPVHLANDVHAGGSCSTRLGKREHLSSSFLCPRHCTSACTWQDSGHAGVLLLEVPYLLHSEVPRARQPLFSSSRISCTGLQARTLE